MEDILLQIKIFKFKRQMQTPLGKSGHHADIRAKGEIPSAAGERLQRLCLCIYLRSGKAFVVSAKLLSILYGSTYPPKKLLEHQL